ncbi:unnamed protein product [marine sediment metagenome]|uniref:CarD-like/TRCF RNAP-interacting domain-containing protein n=1 Tax=marine sediment metagenome TaxID=412755 RepID=X1TIC6_9ZZZZ
MFKVGDLAVYPAQGVGVIEAIEKKEIMGYEQLFYIMKILGNTMTIMIPTSSAKSVGLREVISEKEIPYLEHFITPTCFIYLNNYCYHTLKL